MNHFFPIKKPQDELMGDFPNNEKIVMYLLLLQCHAEEKVEQEKPHRQMIHMLVHMIALYVSKFNDIFIKLINLF